MKSLVLYYLGKGLLVIGTPRIIIFLVLFLGSSEMSNPKNTSVPKFRLSCANCLVKFPGMPENIAGIIGKFSSLSKVCNVERPRVFKDSEKS